MMRYQNNEYNYTSMSVFRPCQPLCELALSSLQPQFHSIRIGVHFQIRLGLSFGLDKYSSRELHTCLWIIHISYATCTLKSSLDVILLFSQVLLP